MKPQLLPSVVFTKHFTPQLIFQIADTVNFETLCRRRKDQRAVSGVLQRLIALCKLFINSSSPLTLISSPFFPTFIVPGFKGLMFLYQIVEAAFNHLKPTGYVMHQQFNIQQLYALPTLYSCVLYLSENKQRLVPLTA